LGKEETDVKSDLKLPVHTHSSALSSFLASAVFSWGLQAKLSLYKPPQSPSTVTVAKLLTERRSAQAIDSLKRAVQSDTAWETLNLIPPLVLAQAILILTFEFYKEMYCRRFQS